MAHFTSALRYPVLLNGKNYSGSPSMTTAPLLSSFVLQYLKEEAVALSDAVWVPLGPAATQGLNLLVNNNVLDAGRVLSGMPHPSPANMERIRYFIGGKPRHELSAKTNADILDRVRTSLRAQVAKLEPV